MKLQKAKKMIQRYKEDRSANLEVIDPCHLEFAFQSQTVSTKWYIVSLSHERCECNDYGPMCKHMLAVKQIVEDEFQHLFDLLLNMYEPHGFIHDLEDFNEDACGVPNEGLSGDLNGGPSGDVHGGPSGDVHGGQSGDLNGGPSGGASGDPNDGVWLNPNVETGFIKEMFLNISNMTASRNIPSKIYASLTMEKRNALKRVRELFMSVFQESMGGRFPTKSSGHVEGRWRYHPLPRECYKYKIWTWESKEETKIEL